MIEGRGEDHAPKERGEQTILPPAIALRRLATDDNCQRRNSSDMGSLHLRRFFQSLCTSRYQFLEVLVAVNGWLRQATLNTFRERSMKTGN
uniref:Uncharacterized protein n=1 Tax=Setaria digitata TaxID=48799 RepID=A0A915Q7J8_9BILA